MLALQQTAIDRAPAGEPDWMRDARRHGYDAFSTLGMPDGTEEAWRYVHLDFDLADFGIAPTAGDPKAPGPFLEALERRAATVTIIDGYVTGVEVGDGLSAVRPADLDEPLVDRVGPIDVFAAAQAAFAQDPLVLRIERNAVPAGPIVVDVQGTHPGGVSFPRLAIDAGVNSEASVVIVYRSSPGPIVVSPRVEAVAGDGARLSITSVQDLDRSGRFVGHLRVEGRRDASIRIGEVGIGGGLGRLDVGVALTGDGSTSELAGIYFGDGDQVLDYRVVVDHRARNTASNVYLKGAVEDNAESVFTGLLKIWKDATNTSTFEENRNLVLSEGAKAHSVPNLEILCDDVVCGHGSTVGPLEEDHLYYLQSRGLSRERAERVLLRGFFEEMIAKLPAPQLAGPVRTAVNEKFTRAQLEGRV